jgi:hypothetical protein
MTSNRELARQLGVSETAVRRAETAGRIKREADGSWDLPKVKAAWAAALLQPAHRPVHGLGERWAERPYRIGKRPETRVQRSIHVATMLKGFLESFGKRPGRHPTTPNVWQRVPARAIEGRASIGIMAKVRSTIHLLAPNPRASRRARPRGGEPLGLRQQRRFWNTDAAIGVG